MEITGEDRALVNRINNAILFYIPEKIEKKYIISIIKVIDLIQDMEKGIEVTNLGETDLIIDYIGVKRKSVSLEILKTILVAVIVFSGTMFSIMTFNQDVSVKEVMLHIYALTGGDPDGTIELFYSVGLGIGIILFFNHFSKREKEEDPTPLQIQLYSFEDNSDKTIIKNSEQKNLKE